MSSPATNSNTTQWTKGGIALTALATVVALGAISALALGILSHQGIFANLDHLVMWSMIAGGGGALVLAGLSILAIKLGKKKKSDTNGEITLVTWNIARNVDVDSRISSSQRRAALKDTFTRLQPDVWCLQKSDDFSTEELKKLFPRGYSITKFGDDTAVVWKKSRFTRIQSFGIQTESDPASSLVFLKDKFSLKKIVVASSHLQQFDLNRKNLVDQSSESGEGALASLAHCLEGSEADLKIVGMDINITPKHLEDLGYIQDQAVWPTFFDHSIYKYVKADYVYAKNREGNVSIETTRYTLSENPSDHELLHMIITVA